MKKYTMKHEWEKCTFASSAKRIDSKSNSILHLNLKWTVEYMRGVFPALIKAEVFPKFAIHIVTEYAPQDAWYPYIHDTKYSI